MRTALSAILALALVGPAVAFEANTMGMFFNESDFSDETRTIATSSAPFNGYVVLLEPSVSSVGGYEVGISLSAMNVYVLQATGPNGWTNFGGNLNHLVGYMSPLSVSGSGTVLATVQMMYTSNDHVQIYFGEADPPSISGGPVIADGGDPDIMYSCVVPGIGGHVASLNRPPMVEDESDWSSVKSLFD